VGAGVYSLGTHVVRRLSLRGVVAASAAAFACATSTAAGPSWQPLTLYDNAVPVLVYHQIGPNTSGGLTVSPSDFGEQLAMLHDAAFHTINQTQYDEFLHGKLYDLPTRPILITFDDGKIASYTGADSLLAKYGFQATMFVIAGFVGKPSYLSWAQLRSMQASGRWQLQLHAGYGHVLVPTGKGRRGPYYANRKLLPDGTLETLAAFEQRVTRDLNWGEGQLKAQIPGFVSNLFSVPFSNYGQDGTNDPAIPGFMQHLLTSRFDAVFLDDKAAWSLPNQAHSVLQRFAVHSATGAQGLYLWLRGSQPDAGPQSSAGGPAPTALSVTVTAPLPRVRVGARLVVRALVRNDGQQPATLVQLQDRLPPNLSLVRARGCALDETRTLTCRLGTLAPGRTASVAIVLRAAARGVAVNSLQLVDAYRLSVGSSENVSTRTTVVAR